MIFETRELTLDSLESGVGIILLLVIILKKPKITIYANPKGSSLDKDTSSHFFALR